MSTMKLVVLAVCLVFLAVTAVEGQQTNWLKHDLYDCVRCLCHARSGCWIRQNCARYSISEDYWKKAGSLTVSPNEKSTDPSAYRNCMRDENCIVGTIIQYTGQFGEDMDCNCDGVFDCKDRAAIHLMGASCENPNFGGIFARRFNECSNMVGTKNMLSQEGNNKCTTPTIF
ncbi:uncharacterized protein [Diabrotica undecimpunctata]|uniref:uncharacterized protein n=1 Tax=Diabrotica undecimpunctata TaxID=50387 RepID=UPI003B634410